jgi:hypothetical protein
MLNTSAVAPFRFLINYLLVQKRDGEDFEPFTWSETISKENYIRYMSMFNREKNHYTCAGREVR